MLGKPWPSTRSMNRQPPPSDAPLDAEALHRFHVESLVRHLIEAGHWVVEDMLSRTHARGHIGLRNAHQNVLVPLKPSGSRLVDLAKESGVTKNAIGQLANELEHMGYLERAPDANDGRAKQLRYTAQGLELLNDTMACIEELNADLQSILGSEKTVQLTELMGELVNGIRQRRKTGVAAQR